MTWNGSAQENMYKQHTHSMILNQYTSNKQPVLWLLCLLLLSLSMILLLLLLFFKYDLLVYPVNKNTISIKFVFKDTQSFECNAGISLFVDSKKVLNYIHISVVTLDCHWIVCAQCIWIERKKNQINQSTHNERITCRWWYV